MLLPAVELHPKIAKDKAVWPTSKRVSREAEPTNRYSAFGPHNGFLLKQPKNFRETLIFFMKI
jgi:hypothetical protein